MDEEKYRYTPSDHSPPLGSDNRQPVTDDVFGNEENNAVCNIIKSH